MRSSILFLLGALSAAYAETPLQLLTDAEALQIVAAQEEAKLARYHAKLAALSNVQIVNTRTVDHRGQQLIINAIKPPVLDVLETAREPEIDPSNMPAPAECFSETQECIAETISIGGTVFGDAHSKVTWRDQETGASFVVWTNVSLNFLQPLMSFTEGGYEYRYFSFVTSYTRAMDAQRQQFAAERGVEVEPLWEEPPVSFTEGQYEYYVATDDSSQIPAKLYRQLDAIFGHYLSNQEAWEVQYHNSQKLAEKRKDYLQAHPPVPQPTVINFWTIDETTTANEAR